METDEPAEAWLEAANGQDWPLGANCSLGRSPSNTIVLGDRKVSRRHAVIHRQNVNEYWLVDLGSANGSYVNDARVSLPGRLKNGDVMRLGDFSFVFHQSNAFEDADTETNSMMSSMTIVEVKGINCWMLLTDIVNSTRLSSEHDPADWALMVGTWAGRCRQIIELHGGVINKYLGDGFLAIWPAKPRQVDHVASALQALFEIQKDVPNFRIAVHKGQVFSGGGRTLGEDSLSGMELVMLFRMEKLTGSLGKRFLCSEPAFEALHERLDLVPAGLREVPDFADDEARAFFQMREEMDS